MIGLPGSIWGSLRDSVNNGVWDVVGSGAPTNGTSGTGVNLCGPGSYYTDYTNANIYLQTGTLSSPTWVLNGGKTGVTQYFSTCTPTNGTTAVNIFSASGAPCALTLTGAVIVARDTTAANITIQQAANTVVTLAKGTSAGVAVGGGTLSNTTYAKADVATVKSSSAGNADVFINWVATGV